MPTDACPWTWSPAERISDARSRGIDVQLEATDAPAIDRAVVCHGDACCPNTLLAADGSPIAHVDLGALGVADRWDLAEDGSGDCEDFQLLKRKLLAQSGLPRRAMRMTVVIDEKGEGHAVLTLLTDRGDLVLDNKTSAVSDRLNATRYVRR